MANTNDLGLPQLSDFVMRFMIIRRKEKNYATSFVTIF